MNNFLQRWRREDSTREVNAFYSRSATMWVCMAIVVLVMAAAIVEVFS